MTCPMPDGRSRIASASLALVAAITFVAAAAALSFLPEPSPPGTWKLRGALDASRPLQAAAKPV